MASIHRKNWGEEEDIIKRALAEFFEFLDEGRCDYGAIKKALETIVVYYGPRLKSVVGLAPSDCINGIVESRDLYQHAWFKLMERGAGIKLRTPAGVCAWLKRVVINYKINLKRSCARLTPLDNYLTMEGALCIEEIRSFLERWHLLPSTCEEIDEIEFRWQYLQELFGKALGKLNGRQQEILRLEREGRSPAEIMKIMGFPSVGAANCFKSRSYKALKKQLYMLFLRELENPRVNLRRKAVIEEWLDRHLKTNREKKRNV